MKYQDIVIASNTADCLLCHQASCTKACKASLPVDRILRALRFENNRKAKALLGEELPCRTCTTKDCVGECIRGKIDAPVPIDQILEHAADYPSLPEPKADLTTKLCGVDCENPFFLSSSVVGSNYEMVAKAFDMGWAGVAFKTIGMFVPEEVSPRFDQLQKEGLSFLGFKNIEQISEHTLEENLEYFKELKKNYPKKVIIASIMGQDEAEWEKLASLVEQAGADIIECNFSCPHMTGEGLGSDVGTDPELVAAYTRATRRGSRLPILAKMTPNISNMEIPALAAVQAGADGIAAINTIKSIMNINLETFSSGPDVTGSTAVGGYSGKAVKPIALRFIHDMKQQDELKDVAISGMGGIETWIDAAEFIAMGCSTVQVTTAIMQYGYRIIDDLLEGLTAYMSEQGFQSIDDFLGKALQHILPADELDRGTICFPKFRRDLCVGCGRCYLSCFDGGHQALSFDEGRQPLMDAKKCVGCHLCVTVCPAGAITAGTRVAKK
ncbi:MAG: NAD-dependent dihydropyrimidine dehydrogenase subunit PreA [Lachnospiraceae bacterium]